MRYILNDLRMKRYLAAVLPLFALAARAMTFLGGPSSTETVYVHDTLTIDNTVRSAMVRFVSLMPDNSPINLKLSSSVDAKIYATTGSGTPLSYLPFIPDSSKWLFLYNGSDFLDSFQVAGTQIRKGSINTFGLFQVQSGVLAYGGDNNDSLKIRPVPTGRAMLRFINGNNWVGGGQLTVNLDTESVTQNGILTSVFAQPPSTYISIPAGSHKLIVSSHGQALDSVSPRVDRFDAGMFYTVRLIGDETHTAQLIVDPE